MGLAAALGVVGATFGLAPLFQPKTALETSNTTVAPARPTQGRVLFERNCAHCHGEDARGDEGPNLHDLAKSDARVSRLIKGGIRGEMPAFGKKFNEADVQALIAYLHTLKS